MDSAKGAMSANLEQKDGKAVPKLCRECIGFLSQLELHCAGLRQINEDPKSVGGLALCGHKSNVRALHSSVQDGCTLCGWLFKCFKEVCGQQRIHREEEVLKVQHLSFIWQRLPLQDSERKGSGHYRFALWSLPIDVSNGIALPLPPQRAVIDNFRATDGDRALLEAVASLGPSTSSKATTDLIRHWIDTCAAKHSQCTSKASVDQVSVLPGRLLDVANADKILVVPTSSTTVKGRIQYAALSHCWGSTNKPQLNKETQHELTEGQPLTSFPATFKDAIELTRGLGLAHLWIDSLCIMQDSEEDWLQESAKMGGVYSNSYVCISATDAVDHDGGCFHTRECLHDTVEPVAESSDDAPFIVGRGRTDTFNWPFVYNEFLVSIDVGSDLAMPAPLNRSRIDRAPLNTRAWVFQERMLAPRTIHCTKTQVMWECQGGWSTESHPVSITSAPSGYETWRGYNAKQYVKNIESIREANEGKWRWEISNSDVTKALKQWSTVIEAYSNKGITVTSDRLIACSAISKATTPILGTFVAGLWEKHLPSQLLWYRHRGTGYYGLGWTEDDQMRPRGVPSWSWASVDGEVRLPAYKHAYESFNPPFGYVVNHPAMIDILKVDVALRSPDVTGAVTGGNIRLRGRLLPLFEHGDETYPFHLQPPDPGALEYLIIRWDEVSGAHEHRADKAVQASEELQQRRFHDLPTGAFAALPWSQTPKPSSFVVLPVMVSMANVDRITGLVLERTGATSGQYRRCGFFHTSTHHLDRLKDLPGEMQRSVSAEQYDPQLGHTFTII